MHGNGDTVRSGVKHRCDFSVVESALLQTFDPLFLISIFDVFLKAAQLGFLQFCSTARLVHLLA